MGKILKIIFKIFRINFTKIKKINNFIENTEMKIAKMFVIWHKSQN